jgi:hypothetical protein
MEFLRDPRGGLGFQTAGRKSMEIKEGKAAWISIFGIG